MPKKKTRTSKKRSSSLKASTNGASKLTDRQKWFVGYYMACGIGTQAAIKAGYSAKSAHAQACTLLKNPKVRAELDRRNRELANSQGEVTPEKVRDRLWHEARGLGPDTSSASRVRALEILAKVCRMIVDRVETKTELTQTNPVESMSTEELIRLARWNGSGRKSG